MWLSCLLVFISSACVLVIELIAGRIMAPYVGVSLYTWTSIIGVVLAGMSAGNYLGGVVADRQASRRMLGVIFIAGAVSCLQILVMTDIVIGQTLRLSLLPRIVVYTAAIFLLPSLILGMVSPLVVKLSLGDLERTGNTVGTIYAFSTAGSILGTFLTGFWLISWLGTRQIVWIVAGVLLLTGLAVGEFHRTKGFRATATTFLAPILAIAMFLLVRSGWNAGRYRAPCVVESDYFCIQLIETVENGRPARALMLDRLIHSYVVLDDPTALGYGYEHAYEDLTRAHLNGRQQINTLFIGGGGYTFPRYIEAVFPNAAVDVIEIDPAVTDVEFLKAYANGLRAVFPHVYVFGRGPGFDPFDRNTYVLMASRQPLDRTTFEAETADDEESARTSPLDEGRLDTYLRSGRALTLTDDFAPVDQLLARLFIERGN
jgi:predicted membrane-bound spermidine synthase